MGKMRVATVAAGAAVALGLLAPRIARAVDSWQESRRQAWIQSATAALNAGSEELPPLPFGVTLNEDDPGNELQDDPEGRTLQQLLLFGKRTPQYQAALMQIAQQENAKAAAIAANPAAAPTVASSIVAANIGPAGARSEYNGTYYSAQDSGRVRAIRVHPTDPNTVYIATTGGGVWRTTNFHTSSPTWAPLTDGVLGSIDLGGMDIDPQNPLNIYVGTGEHGDSLPGGAIMKSTDGGATWQTPVLLSGSYSDGTRSLALTATQVRSVIVDPNNSSVVMAATDVGLFRSTDGGATFAIVDLPNLPGYTFLTGTNPTGFGIEGAYDVVYLGQSGGVSQFMVSGDYACPNGYIPSVRGSHVPNCSAATNGASPVTTGTFGDIWKSTDGGATWSSMRVAGVLPTQSASWGTTPDTTGLQDMGRIGLSASPAADPSQSAVYAMAANINDGASYTTLIFNTRDGGASWNKLATKLTAPTNPTAGTACNTMDMGHGQSWYDIGIAADPGDPTRAIVGGNLCSARTVDGGATWQLTTHWLPSSGSSVTTDGAGPLPYAHADWHTATISRVGGRYVTFAGNDGGIFASYDVFDKTPTQLATWMQPQYGLITTLPYGHGTGDPVLGNAQVLYAGFQDNGTRWRLSHTENIAIVTSLNFDQIQGGDGTGNAVATDQNGQSGVYWAGLPYGPRTFCRPAARDCGRATTIFDGSEYSNWFRTTLSKPSGDSDPFTIRYSPTYDAQASVITASLYNLWKVVVDSNDRVTYTRLTPSGMSGANVQSQHVYASPWTYASAGGKANARVYGGVVTGGRIWHVIDDGSGTFTSVRGGQFNLGGVTFTGSSSVAYPKNAADICPGVTDPTKGYIASSAAITMANGTALPGHLFKTCDGGATWANISGNGTPAPSGTGTLDLPNVTIYVTRLDYSDPTEQTIYVGTELGLYRTTDGGNTWARYGNVPAVRVIDLSVSLNGNLVRASTYGRGIWEMWPHSEANAAVGDLDWDKNGVIDFRDVIALSSRIGKTPAMNDNNTADFPTFFQEPRYDAAVDSNSDSVLDSNDLNTQLQKFGGAP